MKIFLFENCAFVTCLAGIVELVTKCQETHALKERIPFHNIDLHEKNNVFPKNSHISVSKLLIFSALSFKVLPLNTDFSAVIRRKRIFNGAYNFPLWIPVIPAPCCQCFVI